MLKFKISEKNSEQSIQDEFTILKQISHPFIINIHFAFQDTDYLYLVMDYLEGGDLRYQLYQSSITNHKFNERQLKFFIANILLGLDYLHSNNVIHRDIKPENLIFTNNGYLKLTDFGIAKFLRSPNKTDTSGTPGYMAPEVLFGKNHSRTVDYFAVGVIMYEMIYGERPYKGSNRKELKQDVLVKEIHIKTKHVNNANDTKQWRFNVSEDCADFVNKLLKRKQIERLGYNSINEIFEHKWIKYYPWKDLYMRKLQAPFTPIVNEGSKRLYSKRKESKVYEGDTLERYIMFQTFNNEYVGYYYYYNEFDKFDIMNTPCVKFVNRHEDVMGGGVKEGKGNDDGSDSDDGFIGDVDEGMKEIKFDKEGSVGKIKEMDVFMKRKEMFMFTGGEAKALRRKQNKSMDFVLLNGNENVSDSSGNCSYYKTNLFTVYNGSNKNNNNNNDKYSIQSMSTFSTRK